MTLSFWCSCNISNENRSEEIHELVRAVQFTAQQLPVDGFRDTLTIDGIRAVRIADLTWATENLNTVCYCNGDTIPEIQETKQWKDANSGAWCHYGNDPEFGKQYGKLYNWYAVNDYRGLCPCGWEVASDHDWQQLISYFGGKYLAPVYLLGGTWDGPTPMRKNISGFNALPGGFRPTPEGGRNGNDFDGLSGGVWWSSTKDTEGPLTFLNRTAWGMDLSESNSYRANDGWFVGKSVRCVKRQGLRDSEDFPPDELIQ